MSSNLDVTSLVKNDRRRVELRSVIQVKPILSTQPYESDICEGGTTSACTKIAQFRAAVTDSEHISSDGVFTVRVSKTTRIPSHWTRGAVVSALLFQFGHGWKDVPVYPFQASLVSFWFYLFIIFPWIVENKWVKQSGSHMELQGTKRTNEVNIWQILQVLETWCGV